MENINYVDIRGRKSGYRSVSVRVYSDGSIHRSDIPLAYATAIRSYKRAAEAVGMTRNQFMQALTKTRDSD